MSRYTESSVKLDFSGITHFRLETCRGHKNLNNIKEIDFGWWDKREECLYLLELKNYTTSSFNNDQSDNLILNLWKKSIDMMYMLSCVWHGTSGSQDIRNCIPVPAREKCRVKIYHLVKIKPSSLPLLLAVNQRLFNKFQSYKELFDVETFTIVTHRQAQRLFEGIVK